MWNTAIPFMAATTALMLGWLKWRQAPRGANGLLFQYGVLAAANIWVMTLRTQSQGLVWAGVLPILVIWLAPVALRQLVETQYRIGRPGPVGWMLMLRALISWHRRHLVDYVYAPVRLLSAAGKRDMAVDVAKHLQPMWALRGMEPDVAEMIAQTLYQARRWRELLDDPQYALHAQHHPPLRIMLARAKMETDDFLGAAEELRLAAAAGVPGLTISLAWADLLRHLGRDAELEDWCAQSGLDERSQLTSMLEALAAKARENERNETVTLPAPPMEVVEQHRAGEDLEMRMRDKGVLAKGLALLIVLFWIPLYAVGGPNDPGTLVAWGALAPPFVEAGEWWRLLTTTWLHGSWLHVSLNALKTLVIVPFGVAFFGKRLTLMVWVLSAIGGSIGSMLTTAGLSVGASGAVMGIVGLVMGCLLRRPAEVPSRVRNFYLGVLGFLVAVIFIYGFAVEARVDDGGHLGGLVVGLLLGAVLPPVGVRPKPIPTPWLLLASAAPVVLLIATVFGILSAVQGGHMPDPMPHQQVPYGAGQLAVPAWWVDDQANGWDCATTGLEFDAELLGPGFANARFAQLAHRQMRADGVTPNELGLQRPIETLEASGVQRQVIDFWDGKGRWVIWVTRRGNRTGVMRVVGPAGSYALYAEYLDELAARATPPE